MDAIEPSEAAPAAPAAPASDDGVAELRRWLAARGVTAEQMEACHGEGHLPGLASDIVLARGATLSAHDIADRQGLDVKEVVELLRLFGVMVPDPHAPQFTESDLRFVDVLADKAVPGATGPDLPRVVAAAMDRIAEAAVALYVQGPEGRLEQAGATPLEQAEKLARATSMALDLGVGLASLFRHHMRQAIARQRVVQAGVTQRELARLAIGFIDLVGSTSLWSRLTPAELATMVSRFESRAFDVVADAGGRLVKFIGDEIMVAANGADDGCRIIRALVATFTADGLQPRGGLVHGEVLFRHGDYYGPVVNLAARLVDEAIPGEVLVDRSVVDATGDGGDSPRFEPAGRRLLKGFDDPITVWSLSLC